MDKLVVRGAEINVQWGLKQDDFLSLTDTPLKILKNQQHANNMPRTKGACFCPSSRL